MHTDELIKELSQEAQTVVPLASPMRTLSKYCGAAALYAIGVAWIYGLRADLFEQLSHPLFLMELFAIALLFVTALAAAIYLVFPDHYQQPYSQQAVLISLALFVISFALMWSGSYAQTAIAAGHSQHGLECALCIAGVAILPSIIMTRLARHGAPTAPTRLGVYAMIASAALGCFLLRLMEANDAPLHLLVWHYVPMLLLAGLGAWGGRYFLKW